MQPLQQQNTKQQSLRQQDISLIIKHFSFTIQQRFQEIQKNCNYFTCLNSINFQKSDIQKDILHRYNQYKTANDQQIKLLEKFVQRILQIFQFFKQKTEEPQLLQTMGQKINQKLKQILKNQSNYHFFVNNRPKTHTTHVKPLGNRSASNDFLSIVGPSYKQQLDIHSVFINNGKKIRTQTQEKRVVEVGKLFKYVFSVLKRGYLVKLRMQKPEKKSKNSGLKQLSCIQQNNTISVQGTCAILRNCSQKGNKQNAQVGGSRMVSSNKQKLSMFSGYQNKKQYSIFQKVKNRSVSTNQYSILSKDNVTIVKQSSSKLRQLDKKVNLLYEIMNIQKYSVIKVAKDPQLGKKEQLKRNIWIENEYKKYMGEYSKWISRGNPLQSGFSKTYNASQIKKYLFQQEQFQKSEDQPNQNQMDSPYQNIEAVQKKQDFIKQGIINKFQNQNQTSNQNQINQSDPFQNVHISNCIKTQQNQNMNSLLDQKPIQSNVHTLIVCSSRNYYQKDNVLADKSSNLIDITKDNAKNKDFKSRSLKNDRKALRLNLPNTLCDKSNLIDEPNVRLSHMINDQQKNHRHSQKSQYYLHSYHIDTSENGSFIPLLPRRQKNTQNIYEYKNQSISIKRKNINPNFHPLNRCRIFREKKNPKNYSMIQGTSSKIRELDEQIFRSKLKNVML